MARLLARGAIALAILAVPLAAIAGPTPPATSPSTKGSASTPPPPLTPEEAEARRHFDTGLKLYADKDYERALVEFQASYAAVARPSALRNAAQCQRDLHRYALAWEMYRKLLDDHAAQLSTKETQAIEKALSDLESLTGTIDVKSGEDAAAVQVDDRALGTTPLGKPVRADPGPHKIRVFKSGFEPYETTVNVSAGDTVKVEATLPKEVVLGKLVVREEQGRVLHVFVDGQDLGLTPLQVDLAPGKHTVEIGGEGLGAPKQEIELVAKQTSQLVLLATPLVGHLRVETLGKVGDVSIDGKKVGDRGAWDGDLEPGTHEVVVDAPGYEQYKHLVAIERGQTILEAVTLVKKPAPPPPPPPPVVKPQIDPYTGLYARISAFSMFRLAGGADFVHNCPSTSSCSSDLATAPGADLRVGYLWGLLGVEGVAWFDYQLPFNVTETPSGVGNNSPVKHKFSGFSSFLGIGGRVISQDDAVRFTFGLSIGGALRGVSYSRDATTGSFSPGSKTIFAPAIVYDAGLLLGSTPGVKLTLGLEGSLQFPGKNSVDVSPTIGSVAVSSAVEVYLGPTLGLQFGR